MKLSNFKKTVGFTALVVLLPTLAFAYGGQGRSGGQNGPPQVAIEACAGKNIGDMVEFTGRHDDTISATCREKDGQMFAVPENGRGGKGRR
ncbi:MAG: hypothetical protein KAS94_07160 [Desulfobulbaceae bacterium]|nr:hypothetical protein [Desulfobulbaceae bacterium]